MKLISIIAIIAIIAIISIMALLLGPWLFIWSINTLVTAGGVTAFHISFGFWEWLAATLILMVFTACKS